MSAVLSDKEVVFYPRTLETGSVTPGQTVGIKGFVDWATSQIDPLGTLPDNWDGYGASKPSQNVLGIAKIHLASLGMNFGALPPDVSATRTGGVSLFWEKHESSLELELNNFHSIYRYKNGDVRSRGYFPSTDQSDDLVEICSKFFRQSD